MNQLELLSDALTYIEQHLTDSIKTSDIAAGCYCSKSTLEKLFRCINNITIHDYIQRRKMSLAARELIYSPNKTILEVALQFGYGSHESFTRSFEQIWHCKPSEYRRSARYYNLYPRLLCPLKIGDDYMNMRKQVDISELYDLLQERKDCYFICCDIMGMIPINEIARAAGDLAIIEAMNRLYDAAEAEDVIFRIGGDEFAVLTGSTDPEYAKQIADTIASHNKETFHYAGQDIPLSLYTSVVKLDNTKKYSHVFTSLHTTIQENKQ